MTMAQQKNAPRILVIEDESAQMELVSYNLEAQGFVVTQAGNGEEGLMHIEESPPDLVVLDWMLPGVSGIEICRRIKKQQKTRKLPVIMLTARGEESDRIRGLDTGADDYVVKPYSVNELIARVRALLRRTRPTSIGEVLTFDDLVLDSEQHKVTRNARPVKLGPTEFRLLATFMESPKRVWSRERLLDRVWGIDSDVDYRTVDVHIGRLRKALKQPGRPNPIRTVRGTGYSLDTDG